MNIQIIEQRRISTTNKLAALSSELARTKDRVPDFACVYATGSFGRGEAGPSSDLDLFIVSTPPSDALRFNRLDQICLKAALIVATEHLNIPPFDADGQYLEHYELKKLVGSLGKPEDDALNTFMARLLLLLESRPLIGSGAYWKVVDEVLDRYWRDFSGHESEFVPAFLANDILRLWRTLCVNYEARTETQPIGEKIKRRIKNYKLKHARLLTCYSALLYLLHVFNREKTVSKEHARQMVALTPTARLQSVMESEAKARSDISYLLEMYDEFLSATDNKLGLTQEFEDDEKFKARMQSAFVFGDKFAGVLQSMGAGSDFFRLILV